MPAVASGISFYSLVKIDLYIGARLEVTSRIQYLVLHMRIHMAWLACHYDHAIRKIIFGITVS